MTFTACRKCDEGDNYDDDGGVHGDGDRDFFFVNNVQRRERRDVGDVVVRVGSRRHDGDRDSDGRQHNHDDDDNDPLRVTTATTVTS